MTLEFGYKNKTVQEDYREAQEVDRIEEESRGQRLTYENGQSAIDRSFQ
jgi:hypothetical protein